MLRALGLVAATLVTAALALAYPLATRGDALLGARFEHPWVLLGLVAVPLVWLAGLFGEDARAPRLRLGALGPVLAGPRGARSRLRDVPVALRAVSLALLVGALARPTSVLRDERSEDSGIDIMLVLDLSGSMSAILDASPRDLPGAPDLPRGKRLTRLEVAKLVIRDFIERRNDRIGVVVFAKDAYLLSPLTRDLRLLESLVGKLDLRTIDASATAIGDALESAVARLRRSQAESKVVILLTDGDSNAGEVSPEQATEDARSVRSKVYTIQIGNEDEAEVESGTNALGQPNYVRRSFPVNPELLKDIAQKTGGEFFLATDGKALVESFHQILDRLEKTRFEASFQSFEDLFPLLLLPGVLLVALDALLRAWLLRRFP